MFLILQKLSRILRGLGRGTFANFWKVLVSVSQNFVSKKSLGFGFGKFGLEKKVLVSILENLVSEKSISFSFGEFGLRKKYQFQFRKIWYRKKGHRIRILFSFEEHMTSHGRNHFVLLISANLFFAKVCNLAMQESTSV